MEKISKQIQEILTVMNKRFKSMDQKFDSIDKRFESIDIRFDSMDKRFDSMDERIDTLAIEVVNINGKLDTFATKDEMKAMESRLMTAIDGNTKQNKDFDAELAAERLQRQRLEGRVDKIEHKIGIATA